jgi:hypothetical protein
LFSHQQEVRLWLEQDAAGMDDFAHGHGHHGGRSFFKDSHDKMHDYSKMSICALQHISTLCFMPKI